MSFAFGVPGWARSARSWLVIGSVALTLAACGRYAYERREAWREELERRCMSSGMVEMSRYVQRSNPINGPGSCGMDYPLKVSAVSKGRVGFSQTQTLACQMVPTIDRWVDQNVQPAAQRWLSAYVVEVKAGSYSCRSMVGNSRARTSEHAYGNALDVFAFRLSDGREITVRSGWRGSDAEQGFLKEVFIQACDHFTTVLGPGYDQFHYDHFHIDLARHSPDWSRRICRPRAEQIRMPDAPPQQNKSWFRLW